MSILLVEKDKMFTIFENGNQHYLSVVPGCAALFTVTISPSQQEAGELVADKKHAEALACRVTTSSGSFEDRRVRPWVMP